MKNTALKTSGAIFMLVALAHFVRVMYKVPVTAGSVAIPLWVSVVGCAAALLLGMWMFGNAKK